MQIKCENNRAVVKKIAILGQNGCIGRALANHLTTKGYVVRSFSGASLQTTDCFSSEARRQNLESLAAIFSEYCVVVFCLGKTRPGLPQDELLDPLVGDIARLYGESYPRKLAKFIYLSSGGAVYGDSVLGESRSEQDELRPISVYGEMKVRSEAILWDGLSRSTESLLVLRLSNIYGFGRSCAKRGLVDVAIVQALKGENHLTVFGDGSIVRDYLHIYDLCLCIESCIKAQLSGVFNVGTGIGTTIMEVIGSIEHYLRVSFDLTFLPRRACDPLVNVLNTERIESAARWTAHIPKEVGIALAVRDNKVTD